MHGIDAGSSPGGDQRMSHLVVGNPSALFLAEHPALLFDAGNDPLNGDSEVFKAYVACLASGRGDRGLVDQVGEIGAGETGGETRDLV